MSKPDEYPTCKRTYATLRIYHKTASPEFISKILSLEPSERQIAGRIDPKSKSRQRFPLSGWFLTSRGSVESRDLRDHVDWVLAQIHGKKLEFDELRSDAWWMDVSCFWLSRRGHGGPTLSPDQMSKLGNLSIEIWFDVYFSGNPVLDSKDNILTPAD